MIKLEINGKIVECESGSMIIEAADNANIYIPRFCYHKKLSIAANCRMCLVEVEKSPKPLPACATPVNEGMKVFTKSPRAVEAQKYVMEFLLINHPLDCPICDQGGECELQDLSMGFGGDHSNFTEGKRSVHDEDLGSLVASDLTRCIQCTRCVRFSQEIAGVPELGLMDRGEYSKITTYVKETLKSELSGNIIDLCPVGALTSKPYRFKARAWELTQIPSIAAHDCVGSNIYVHTRRGEILRVVPKDNEKLNETWISDRDRFSYLGLCHEDRVQKPMIKHQGQWQETDWAKAFEYAAKGLKSIIDTQGANQIAALLAPTATTEEAYLLQKIIRDLTSENIDYRIQQTDFRDSELNPLSQVQLDEFSNQECIFLIGSNLRREQPILSNRVRTSTQNDGRVVIMNPIDIEFNFPIIAKNIVHPEVFVNELAAVAKALKAEALSTIPLSIKQALATIDLNDKALAIAAELTKGTQKIIVLGALALNHPQAAELKSLARIIAVITGAKIIELTSGPNSQGAFLVGASPKTAEGLNYQQAIAKKLKAYILFALEPAYDCANPASFQQALASADMVIAFSAFKSKSLEQYADIILPIVPVTETDGTFVNVQGDWQNFKAIVTPYGEARPGWKVLRVFANMLELAGYQYASCEEVRQELLAHVKKIDAEIKIFDTKLTINSKPNRLTRISEWPLYRIDSVVRRAKALQECGANEILTVRIHPQLAKSLKINAGEQVRVTQQGQEVILPVELDTAISERCVYVPNGYHETSKLGESFGEIAIEKRYD